jgi:seryl-tRNA synthetase
MRILLLLTGCALSAFHPSGASAQSSSSSSKLEELQKQLEASQKELEEANARIFDLIRKPLSDFTNESPPRCESENLRKSVANALNVVETVESREFKFDPKEQLNLGSTIVDVADAARKAGCNKEARAVYDYVIGVFVGSGYAVLRQRAESGIQDLSKR